MNMPLTDFLVNLAQPDNYQAYSNDPDAFMEKCGLDKAQRKAIKSGNRADIRRLASREMAETSFHAKLTNEIFAENRNASEDFGAIEMDYDDDTDNDNNNDDYGNSDLDVEDDGTALSKKHNFGPHYEHLFNKDWKATKDGELVFVGTGIKGTHHITLNP